MMMWDAKHSADNHPLASLSKSSDSAKELSNAINSLITTKQAPSFSLENHGLPSGLGGNKVYMSGMLTSKSRHLFRVALLEDNPIESEGLARLLEENNYQVISFRSGNAFIESLKSESFDLALLDWNVPDLNGYEVLKYLRNKLKSSCVVLMLTSRVSEYDVVHALNSGADDFMQKPWGSFELLARINALMRRRRQTSVNQDARFGSFLINLRTKHAWRNGQLLHLNAKEFLLFHLFLTNMNCPLSRSHIIDVVWDGEAPEGRIVDVYVSRIRNKAALTMENGYRLHSIYKYGYQLDTFHEE